MRSSEQVTRLLKRWSGGDSDALEALVPILYDELKSLARLRLRKENRGQTLNATALVHEAYIRMVDIHEIEWKDRRHFLAMAARQMRRILIDHAKEKRALKRGAGVHRSNTDPDDLLLETDADLLADVDEGLHHLERHHPRSVQAIELHYFWGLTLEETAATLEVSLSTVVRDLRFAEAWLGRHWSGHPDDGEKQQEPG